MKRYNCNYDVIQIHNFKRNIFDHRSHIWTQRRDRECIPHTLGDVSHTLSVPI